MEWRFCFPPVHRLSQRHFQGCSAAGLSSIEAGARRRIRSNVGAPRAQAKFFCCSDRFVRYVLRDRHLNLELAVGDVSFIDGVAQEIEELAGGEPLVGVVERRSHECERHPRLR